MIKIIRTDSNNLDFQKLVIQLDESLSIYYKGEQSFYEKFNKIEKLKQTVLAYNEEGEVLGCGGIKRYSEVEVEVKRMFVLPNQRGKGIASSILNELENWSKELNFKSCILETMKAKKYAIEFYKKNRYKEIPNFGAYINANNSICFEKKIRIR